MRGKKISDILNVLVVDDSSDTIEIVQRQLSSPHFRIYATTSAEEAIRHLEFNKADLVLTDLRMPGIGGLDLVRYIKHNLKDTEVIIMTAFPDVETAVKSVKDGALDYLTKPFTENELLSAVERVREKTALRRINGTKPPADAYGIIGSSEGMKNVFFLIERASSTNANVMISGESGTGKELVARAIHYKSDRASSPFVSVNCTAIPDTLVESELFGHVKGAFTGAKESRAGFFQIAEGGTIFLDEIGDASQNLQGKLLRVLQDKEIHMVGSSVVKKVDTRIIAATHKNLKKLVKEGLFREDLYYRLNVVDIVVPPLRERHDDIVELLSFFTRKYAKEMGREIPEYSDNALKSFINHSWPGNVRELENLIQRLMVVLEGNAIRMPDLPPEMRFHIESTKWEPRSLSEVENEHIIKVLASVGGNKTRAAEILEIDRKTLRKKLEKAGIPFEPDAT